MTNCATAPGSPRSHPPSPLHGGWGLLKLYAASLACFVLVGSIVFMLYLILSSNAGDTWSTEEQMLLPPPIVLLLAGVVMYWPIIWAAALPLAAIATSLYCALALTFSPRILRAGVGALWGALAAVATAVAFQSPEVFHTGAAWAPRLGIGAAIAGAVSGALAAIIARPWRSAPKSGSAVVDPTRGGHSRVTVVLAWGVALAAIAVAFINGRARTDEVLLRRDRAIAADALRALPVAERAGVVAEMLASANHQSSIADYVPGRAHPQRRVLTNRAAIERELVRLQERLGPTLSTQKLTLIADDGRLWRHYDVQHKDGEARETTVYRWRDGALQLAVYNLSLHGQPQGYASLLVSR